MSKRWPGSQQSARIAQMPRKAGSDKQNPHPGNAAAGNEKAARGRLVNAERRN